MKSVALLLAIAPCLAFAKTYDCRGSTNVTIADDNGKFQKTSRNISLAVTVNPKSPNGTLRLDTGEEPVTYAGPIDLTGHSDLHLHDGGGGDKTIVHTRLNGSSKIELSVKFTESSTHKTAGVELTTLNCQTN